MNNKTFWKLIDKLEENYDINALKNYIVNHEDDVPDYYNEFIELYNAKVAILRFACAEMSVHYSELRNLMCDSETFVYLLRSAVLSGQEVWQELVDEPQYLVNEGFSRARKNLINELFKQSVLQHGGVDKKYPCENNIADKDIDNTLVNVNKSEDWQKETTGKLQCEHPKRYTNKYNTNNHKDCGIRDIFDTPMDMLMSIFEKQGIIPIFFYSAKL